MKKIVLAGNTSAFSADHFAQRNEKVFNGKTVKDGIIYDWEMDTLEDACLSPESRSW